MIFILRWRLRVNTRLNKIIILKFEIIMKKYFLNPLKKAAKWYLKQSMKNNMMLPSGMIPYNYINNK